MRVMFPGRLVRLLVAAALLAAPLAGPALAAEGGPQPLPAGQEAPEFHSVDLEGKPFVLSETLARGPVMLVFWSIFCGTCRDELPILQQAMPKIEGRGVQLVAVNLDEPSRNRTVQGFANQQGFTFPIVFTNVGEERFGLDDLYQVRVTPALYLVKAGGTIAYSHYGALAPEEIEGVLALAD